MPYNTRRKSLSLPSLGIHVPVTHAERAAAASRASANHAATHTRAPSQDSMASSAPSTDDSHPTKKLKRAHAGDDDASLPSAPVAKRRDDTMKYTPPPSPPSHRPSIEMDEDVPAAVKKIDLEGINDDIVEAVIVQLQETGNRPHLVKELTAVLMQSLKVVQQSANPCAIISSRLSSYLKRPCWSALAPCPLAKELETVHPRRTYFYLTTCPHQPLPDPAHAATLSQLAHARTIISPSLSSAASGSGSEDADPERRRELSPSPEVDLSSPEFDDMDDDIAMPSTPIGSLSLRGFGHAAARLSHGSGAGSRTNRAASPPLEKDEKEFTQTADGLQKRKMSGDLLSASTSLEQVTNMEVEYGVRDDSGLFGDKSLLSAANISGMFVTSPAIRPSPMSLNLSRKEGEADAWAKLDSMLEWDRSPENVELEELDGLLSGF